MNIGGFELDLTQVATLLVALIGVGGNLRLRHGQKAKAAEITEVVEAVKPNGGSSLRDAIDRIEQKVGTLADRIDVLEARATRRPFWRL